MLLQNIQIPDILVVRFHRTTVHGEVRPLGLSAFEMSRVKGRRPAFPSPHWPPLLVILREEALLGPVEVAELNLGVLTLDQFK
jgi:hypothetical protein